MAKKQTRRCFSVRAEAFVRLERAAASRGVPMAQLAERFIHFCLDHDGDPYVTREEALRAIAASDASRQPRRRHNPISGIHTL